MSITIRQAKMDDVPTLQDLIAESVRVLSARYYTGKQIESAIINIFGIDTQLIADSTYFVAETEGRLAGCGGWSKRKTLYGGDQRKEKEDPLLDPATEAARIRAFFVHPDFARRGVGSLILQTCEEAARSAQFTRLELVATLPGEPFYRAFGYQEIQRFDAEMPDSLALRVILMSKRVEDEVDA